jgi:lipopolysaccharide transport system permease protein
MSTAPISSTTIIPERGRGNMRTNVFTEFWRYRELLYFFAWRDIKVRYRQAVLGAAWAVIQPLLNMVVFAFIFGRLAHMPSNGIPYPLFSYCALVPWTYFSGTLGIASNSLTGNTSLLTKVYFPRILLPAGTVLAGLLDFGIATVLLIAMMFYYHVKASWLMLLSPLAILLMIVLTLGTGMLMAAMSVKYRDIKYVLPFVIQLMLFATPIIYPSSVVPERFRPFLALNPVWGMVDCFRACLLPNQPFDFKLIGISIGVTLLVFVAGLYYFRKSEKTFADII